MKRAVERFEPALVSEHACCGPSGGEYFNDLLPLPLTEEAVHQLAGRVREVQDALGRQILIENLSSYLGFATSHLAEWEFLAALVQESDCALLLDVNNIYVNSVNLGLDAERYIAGVPSDAVREIHLAGHLRKRVGERELLIDDHGSVVHQDVWRLYELALQRFGPVPTLIEWDTDVPALEVLVGEARLADRCLERVRERAA